MATGIPEGDELALLEPHRAALPRRLFAVPFAMPFTDGSGYPRDNMLYAQQMLNEAGWVMKDGKRVHKDTGEVLSVEFMMNQRTFQKVLSIMARNLGRLGIEATYRFVDDSQYQKRINSRDFDIISIWWNYGLFFPGNEQVGFWHSNQADIEGGNNYSGLKDPVVDDLLAQLLKATTIDELRAASHALDRVLLWKHLVIPHWHLGAWRLLYWDKFGIPNIQPSYGLAIESWWSKELAP
jgi:microcin C transport system substrate-binding protein